MVTNFLGWRSLWSPESAVDTTQLILWKADFINGCLQIFWRHLLLHDLGPMQWSWNTWISSNWQLQRYVCTLTDNTLNFFMPPKMIHFTIWIIISNDGNTDRLCGLVVRVAGYRSWGPGFDSRRYQVSWEVVGLEWGPLSLVRITEKLLESKSSAPV
jgi:hypothetical protein